MRFLVIAIATLCVSGCALFSGDDQTGLAAPAIVEPENVVPASFTPIARPRDRVATGRPLAIVPCVTGARISDLCRRDAESHLYVEAVELSQ